VRKVYLIVEGQGDEQALPKLLNKFAIELGLDVPVFEVAQRSARCSEADVRRQCEDLRSRDRISGAMFLRDDEDGCPKVDAPKIAEWIRREKLPFPVAVVLFYREYETMFVATLDALAARPLRDRQGNELPSLDSSAKAPANPELHRDAKAQLSKFLPKKHPYRETSHQFAMTQALDIAKLRASGLPCVGSLERALRFVLSSPVAGVYPALSTASEG